VSQASPQEERQWREIRRRVLRTGITTPGDASLTATVLGSTTETVLFSTTLTANRTLTLSTTNAVNGDSYHILRTAGGAFTLDVGPGLITLAQDTWCAVVFDGSAWKLTAYGALAAGGSSAYTTVEDEGTPLTARSNINFVGSGVTAADSGGKTVVTIPGLTAYTTVEDEGTPLTARTTVNFVGAGVTATDSGGKTVVTIPGGGSSSISTITVAFTDGDTARRVTVSDGTVSGASKIIVTVRRPDTTSDSADRGYLYTANVVRIGAGQFDVLITALGISGEDVTLNPPSETITLFYLVA